MPRVLDRLDAGALRRWARDALDRLGSHRDEIDGLNVFPVPDGDTGTNLYLTVESAVAEVDRLPEGDDLGRVADALAAGALRGARGSSGVILSQLLRGVADALREHPDGGARAVRAALVRAADSAYAAVNRPAEGTMLSVARAAAEGAGRGSSLREVVSGALASARAALDRTPSQLDQLGRAGVVDAGGRGLLLVLESLAGTVAGRRPARGRSRGEGATVPPRPSGSPAAAALVPVDGPPFEVMYLLDAPACVVPALRDGLQSLGESVVVVGGADGAQPGTWKVHVHTADVAGALDLPARLARAVPAGGLAAGGLVAGAVVAGAVVAGAVVAGDVPAGQVPAVRTTEAVSVPRHVRVASVHAPTSARGGAAAPGDRPGVAVVAVAAGSGLARLLAASGALVVLRTPGAPPSPDDLLQAVRDTGAPAVVVVPDDAESATAAGSAARAAAAARAVDPRSPRVAVLPACAPVPALAALSVHDAARSLPLAVEAMSAAAAATRAGVVRTAGAADAPVSGCRSGDAVGLVGSEVVAVGADAAVVGEAVADRLLGAGGELLTVLHGALPGAHPAASALSRAVRRARPDVEVHVLDGGQEGAVLLLGVE